MESIEYKGYTIETIQDDNAESPRTWDNLGTIICFHKRYSLGDNNEKRGGKYLVTEKAEDFNGWDGMAEYLIKEKKAVVVFPLHLYDHSGISIKVGNFYGLAPHASWDSGQVGFIYITKEKALKEFSKKKLTKALINKLEKLLIGEVETYNQYLTGDVYGFKVMKNDTEFDACWGFFGEDDAIAEAKSNIDYYAEEEKKLTPALMA